MPLALLEATDSGATCCRCAMTRPPQLRTCRAEGDVTSSCVLGVPQAWAAVHTAVQEQCMLSGSVPVPGMTQPADRTQPDTAMRGVHTLSI